MRAQTKGGVRACSGIKPSEAGSKKAIELISEVIQNARDMVDVGRHTTILLKVPKASQEVA